MPHVLDVFACRPSSADGNAAEPHLAADTATPPPLAHNNQPPGSHQASDQPNKKEDLAASDQVPEQHEPAVVHIEQPADALATASGLAEPNHHDGELLQHVHEEHASQDVEEESPTQEEDAMHNPDAEVRWVVHGC